MDHTASTMITMSKCFAHTSQLTSVCKMLDMSDVHSHSGIYKMITMFSEVYTVHAIVSISMYTFFAYQFDSMSTAELHSVYIVCSPERL